MNKISLIIISLIISYSALSNTIDYDEPLKFDFRYSNNKTQAYGLSKDAINLKSNSISVNDYEFINQWALENKGQRVYNGRGISGLDIGASSAWNLSEGVADGVIAIIGTKVDLTHEDLQNSFWVNLEEIPDNGVDDDANGFIDDIKGINVLEDNGNIHDSSITGLTPIVGIISAEKNNNIGIAGLTNNKILPCIIEDGVSSANISQLQKCFDHIKYLKNTKSVNVHTILLTWGVSATSKNDVEWLKDMLLDMLPLDINIVAPVKMAGTAPYDHLDSIPDYPSSFNLPHVISVTASNKSGFFLEDSGYGFHTVNLAAPGSDILTTTPGVMPKLTKESSIFFDDFENGLENWTSVSKVFSVVGETNRALSIHTVNAVNSENEAELISIPVDLSTIRGKPAIFSYKIKIGSEGEAPAPISLEIGADGINGQYGIPFFTYQSENWRHYYRFLPGGHNYTDEQLKKSTLEIKVTHIDSEGFNAEVLVDDLAIGILSEVGASNKYEYFHGTSAAAAHVAGAVSLIKGFNPDLSANNIKNLLISSGVKILNWNYPGQNIPTDWVMGGNTLKIYDDTARSAMTCSNEDVLRRVFPTFNGVIAVKDHGYPLGVLNIKCENPNQTVEVFVNDNSILLNDDGIGVDEFQNDGIYSKGVKFNEVGDFQIDIGNELNPNLNVRVFDMYKDPVEVPYEWEVPEDGLYNDRAIFEIPPFPINIGNVIDIHESYPGEFLIHPNGTIIISKAKRSNLDNINKAETLSLSKMSGSTLPLDNDNGAIIIATHRQNSLSLSGIVSFTSGVAPNRKWVIEWRDRKQDGCDLPLHTYQTVFHETEGTIQFNYKKALGGECQGIAASAGIQIGTSHWSIYSGDLRDELSLKFETISSVATNINQAPQLIKTLPRIDTTQLSGEVINLAEYFKDENMDSVTFNLDETRNDFLLNGVEIIRQELHINTREILSTGTLQIQAVDEQGLVSDYAYLTYSVQGEAPQVIQEFGEVNLEINELYEVNLDDYFKDKLDSSLNYEVRDLDSGFTLSTNILSLNFSSSGLREFLIVATDSDNLGSVLEAKVRVEEQNNAPSATNDSIVTEFETAVTINILSNDSDSDGGLDMSSISIVSNVSSGNLEVLSTGDVKYTPNAAFSGNDSFTYTVDDNDGATSNEATVTITVKAQSTPAPTPTPTTPPPSSGGGGGSTSILLMLMMLAFAGRRYYR